jgi:hypothetical protein
LTWLLNRTCCTVGGSTGAVKERLINLEYLVIITDISWTLSDVTVWSSMEVFGGIRVPTLGKLFEEALRHFGVLSSAATKSNRTATYTEGWETGGRSDVTTNIFPKGLSRDSGRFQDSADFGGQDKDNIALVSVLLG